VGIYDTKNRHLYWTQKALSKGGKSRIFQAGANVPADELPSSRTNTELLFKYLPEPIDLGIAPNTQTFTELTAASTLRATHWIRQMLV